MVVGCAKVFGLVACSVAQPTRGTAAPISFTNHYLIGRLHVKLLNHRIQRSALPPRRGLIPRSGLLSEVRELTAGNAAYRVEERDHETLTIVDTG